MQFAANSFKTPRNEPYRDRKRIIIEDVTKNISAYLFHGHGPYRIELELPPEVRTTAHLYSVSSDDSISHFDFDNRYDINEISRCQYRYLVSK